MAKSYIVDSIPEGYVRDGAKLEVPEFSREQIFTDGDMKRIVAFFVIQGKGDLRFLRTRQGLEVLVPEKNIK